MLTFLQNETCSHRNMTFNVWLKLRSHPNIPESTYSSLVPECAETDSLSLPALLIHSTLRSISGVFIPEVQLHTFPCLKRNQNHSYHNWPVTTGTFYYFIINDYFTALNKKTAKVVMLYFVLHITTFRKVFWTHWDMSFKAGGRKIHTSLSRFHLTFLFPRQTFSNKQCSRCSNPIRESKQNEKAMKTLLFLSISHPINNFLSNEFPLAELFK